MFKRLLKVLSKAATISVDDVMIAVASNKFLQQDIIYFNTVDQLFNKGINAEGESLEVVRGIGYAFDTIKDKIRKGLPYDRITLYDTGKFYSSFRIQLIGTTLFIVAETVKGDTDLIDEFGPDIIGLTPENKEKILVLARIITKEYILTYLLK